MSGTRSHSRKAPATRALIVAHGQPSNPEPAEMELARLAAQVQCRLPDWQVTSATMAAPGSLEAAMAELPDDSLIYPLFMTDGWFVKTALRTRLRGRNFNVLPPMGLDRSLPSVAARAIRLATAQNGWPLWQTRVLVAAHGSGRSDNAAAAAYQFASNLQNALPCAGIETGFIEQAPPLEEAARKMHRLSICMPFLAMAGEHVQSDVPDALNVADFQGVLLPALGQTPGIHDLVAQALHSESKGKYAA